MSKAEAEVRCVINALEQPGWYLWPRDCDAAGGAGMPPLDEATLGNQLHVVTTLREGYTALHRAAQLAHIGAVTLLAPCTQVGPNPATSWAACFCTLRACGYGSWRQSTQIVSEQWLSRSWSTVPTLPAAKDGVGWTPLTLTSCNEVKEVLQ
ncbi:hypothetical protein HK405_004780 [Cladochytrium tenue]|nr:hypothetical protein HK405_004780 [Cladochytrium tenue]